ncbi:MAG: cation diffusion facilitator family transporter [Butyrivibrio sp.]|nr:cation diffusion facilitator family transporter [Butyrivibrio sp.]
MDKVQGSIQKGKTEIIDNISRRNKEIVKTGIIGITANVFLALFKAVIGVSTQSIAITLDAVNNITDAGSSIITIVGTKLAEKKPDKEHPWGHGRIEYLSAMILAALVLTAGLSSFIEAVQNIVNPRTPEYSPLPLIIIGICVLVKIFLGKYTTAVGKKVNSETLVNSGKDALMDALVSTSTIIAALIFIFTDISLEPYLGAVISILIIKTGIEMESVTISEIMGERVSSAITKAVIETVESYPEVHGVYDAVFHDYGPNRVNGSLHIEVDDTMVASEISNLIRRITIDVFNKHGVMLTAIGIYSMNTGNEKAMKLREEITKIALSHEHVLQLHGFYLKGNDVQFDIIVDFDAKNRAQICDHIAREVHDIYPELNVNAFLDADYSFSE